MRLFRIILRAIFYSPPQKKRHQTRGTYKSKSKSKTQTRFIYQERKTVIIAGTTTPEKLCGYCHVIDGDTIVINKIKIRLAGIDAPELHHPWGKKSKWAVIHMCKGKKITAILEGHSSHDRVVATCYLPDGRDIAEELVKAGLAIDWPKFSGEKYRQFEPPGIRKKLWRADARQKGKYFE